MGGYLILESNTTPKISQAISKLKSDASRDDICTITLGSSYEIVQFLEK